MPNTIDSAVRWWAVEEPDRPALSFAGDRVAYSELDGWVGRVAAHFLHLGLAPGDRVVLIGENSLEICVAMLAAMRAGGIAAALSTRLVASELAWIIGDYAPALLVVADAVADRVGDPTARPTLGFADIAALRHGADVDVAVEREAGAVALLITTSGSTARPKGVMFSQEAIVESSSWQAIADPMPSHYRRFVIAPMSTSAGSFSLTHTLLAGGTAYLEAKFDAESALEIVERERISFIACSPIFFQRMAEAPAFAAADLTSVHIAHTGGAAVAKSLLRTWADKGVILRQLYGQTECGGTGVVNSREHALTKPESCGGPAMFTEVAIVDPAGRRLPAGKQGEILLHGPGFMLGYWNNPEATAKTIVDGWLHTGDIGVLDEMGHLRMIDRLKDIIISGGINISAAEVERVVGEVRGVDEVAVIAARDEKFGEVPMAVIYGNGAAEDAAIVAHCNTHLSAYKVPRYVVRSTKPLPRLTSGKISKPALREMYGGTKPLPERVR